MTELHTLITDLVVGESPRWHDGRLWFANWGVAREIVAADTEGKTEVIAHGPKRAGYCLEWLPDGRLLVTGEDKILYQDGEVHADLSGQATSLNEIVLDARGNIYVNDVGFRFGEEDFPTGSILLVTPDGTVTKVAEQVMFPNGMVITPDNKTLIVAESWASRLTAFDIEPDGGLSNRRVWAPVNGDGLALDAEGAVWASDMVDDTPVVRRVREGEILDEFETPGACFACALGGDDGRTLFLMVAQWRGIEHMDEMFGQHTGKVLTMRVDVPAARTVHA